jgi:hypothetical protein
MAKRKTPTYEEFLAQHSAGLRSLGFDEQFACFVNHLLDLRADESISYEKVDDIAIKRKDGTIDFIQVKNSADTPIRKMTTSSGDFWKTLELWVEGYNHYTESDKKEYFDKRTFTIATNMTVDNQFYDEIEKFQKQLTDIHGLRKWLTNYSSDDDKIKRAVETIKKLTDDELRCFALHVKMKHYTDLTQEMYNTSLVFSRENPLNDDVLMELIAKLNEDKKKGLSATGKFELSKLDFISKYRETLQKFSIDPIMNVTEYDPEHWERPANIDETNMLRQLWDIGELEKDKPSEKTYRYMYQDWYYRKNIERFRDAELMDDNIQNELEKKAKTNWKRTFDRHETRARNKTDEVKKEEAVECFHDTMDKPIEKYDLNFSGGCYLKLSEEQPPKIGWHVDWEKMY